MRPPLGSFEGRDLDATDVVMRSAVLMAIDEIPDDLLRRILGRRPSAAWQDYEDARRQIAEHIVVRVRTQIDCQYVSRPAIAR